MNKRRDPRTSPDTAEDGPQGPDSDVHIGADNGVTIDGPQSHADEQKMADALNATGRWDAEAKSGGDLGADTAQMLAGAEKIKSLLAGKDPDPKLVEEARLDMVEGFAGVLTQLLPLAGATRTETVAPGGAPGYQGLPEATDAAADTVDNFEIETHNAHADSGALRAGGGTIKALLLMDQVLTAGGTRIGQTTVPLARELASTVSDVCQAAAPEVPRNLDLQRSLSKALEYIGGKAAKGNQTKAKNKALKAKTAQETEQQLKAQGGEQGQAAAPPAAASKTKVRKG